MSSAPGSSANRNNSEAISYFTNAEFGIQNPLAANVPDLSQINVAAGTGATAVGDPIRFGSLADGIRIFDVQNTFTYADTLSITKGKHSLRVGGEFRRNQLNGRLQEGQNGRHNARSWFDFLTVGYRNPGDGNRARQIWRHQPDLRRDGAGISHVGLELVRGRRLEGHAQPHVELWHFATKFSGTRTK